MAVVFDGEIPLKYAERNLAVKDNTLKKGGIRQTSNAHYSLICTQPVSEAAFLETLRSILQMPQVFPCRIHAAAENGDLVFDWEGVSGLDGPVRIIHEAGGTLPLQILGMDKLDVAGRHAHISIEKPTFSSLLSTP
ncbi:hypothetical protein HDU88_004010 [Geranomyces variabilis]|nr:hypothetical protein HDU88_004010 [Geranomyces variabilis]